MMDLSSVLKGAASIISSRVWSLFHIFDEASGLKHRDRVWMVKLFFMASDESHLLTCRLPKRFWMLL